MSPSNNRFGGPRRAGFTLTELLVGMVIFLTIMAGVTALFAGTINTVQQGYRTLDAYELARGALAVMERDLQTAFTSLENGDLYYFHGQPNGFVFVGMLEDGQMGRVTYTVHPAARAQQFRTVMPLPWQDVLERISTQARERASAIGANPNTAAVAAENFLRTVYAAEIPADPEFPVDFPVVVSTQSLVRYEDSPRTASSSASAGLVDLNSLPLPQLPNGDFPEWRYIDPENAAADDVGDIAGAEPGTADGYSWRLYLHTISGAVNPGVNLAAGAVSYANDLREAMQDVQFSAGAQLYALRPELVERLITARRYETWLRMVTWPQQDLTQLGLPSFWQDKDINDYVVAEKIVAEAILLDPDTQQPLAFNRATAQPAVWDPRTGGDFVPFDALYVPDYFTYSADTEEFRDSYNAVANVKPPYQGSETWLADYMASPTTGTLLDFDQTLAYYASGPGLASASMGTPLAPSLPTSVRVGFWIMIERPRPGAADFRQWFSQTIEIPAGARRDPVNGAVPAPGRV